MTIITRWTFNSKAELVDLQRSVLRGPSKSYDVICAVIDDDCWLADGMVHQTHVVHGQ